MKIVSAAWFVLVAQLALLPFEVTASCTDREDEFEDPKGKIRAWCSWVRDNYKDPATHPAQCSVKQLTDHCPELCQKQECGFPCADRTEAFKYDPNLTNEKANKAWCFKIRADYKDPATHPAQCLEKQLTDHCPQLCQKQECGFPCADRTDVFKYDPNTNEKGNKAWCFKIRADFLDAEYPSQCADRQLTDHCPQLCEKRDCGFPCADRTDAFQLDHNPNIAARDWCFWVRRRSDDQLIHRQQCLKYRLNDHCPELCGTQCVDSPAPTMSPIVPTPPTPPPVPTKAPLPAPTPEGGGGNNADLEIIKQKVEEVAQKQVQIEAGMQQIFAMVYNLSQFMMNPATSAPSEFHSTAPSTACQVPNPEFLGDGMCDGGDYNTDVCNYDGGDCVEFNEKYPNCNVPDPTLVGDEFCDDQHNLDKPVYNVAECDYDGGDCASGSA